MTNTQKEIGDLIELAKNGDDEAFTDLINKAIIKIKPSLFKHYNNLSQDDFKDATQIAMVKAWRKLENFRGESAFSTWFYIILKNEILNILNKKRIIREHECSFEEIKSINSLENDSSCDFISKFHFNNGMGFETALSILQKKDDLKEYKDMINSALEKLKPSHSKIIRMIFEEGKSYKDVAQELEIPLGTVMSRLFFARKNAQKLILQYAQRNNIQLPNLGKRI